MNARYYDPQIKRFLNPDTFDNLGANGDLNAFNLYAYCSNNPVMYVDPTGEFIWWAITLVVVAVIAATANDIYEIVCDYEVYPRVSDDETVTIENSYNIVTPWVQYGYSFYLNHINDETKDIIQGSTLGLSYEWTIHNLGCDIGTALGIEFLVESGKDLTVGATVFNDYDGSFAIDDMRDWFSLGMSLIYFHFGLCSIIDYYVYMGTIK